MKNIEQTIMEVLSESPENDVTIEEVYKLLVKCGWKKTDITPRNPKEGRVKSGDCRLEFKIFKNSRTIEFEFQIDPFDSPYGRFPQIELSLDDKNFESNFKKLYSRCQEVFKIESKLENLVTSTNKMFENF